MPVRQANRTEPTDVLMKILAAANAGLWIRPEEIPTDGVHRTSMSRNERTIHRFLLSVLLVNQPTILLNQNGRFCTRPHKWLTIVLGPRTLALELFEVQTCSTSSVGACVVWLFLPKRQKVDK